MKARGRQRTLRSTTTQLATERGNLFITVCVDEDGRAVEVFGSLGKAGSPEQGMVETACRLISLHLRRRTPVAEIVGQCRGITDMRPWPNVTRDGGTVYVRGVADGVADGIAHVLAGLEEADRREPAREAGHMAA